MKVREGFDCLELPELGCLEGLGGPVLTAGPAWGLEIEALAT